MADRTVEHANFTLERHYDAAPAQVFRAFTDKDVSVAGSPRATAG